MTIDNIISLIFGSVAILVLSFGVIMYNHKVDTIHSRYVYQLIDILKEADDAYDRCNTIFRKQISHTRKLESRKMYNDIIVKRHRYK